MPATAPRADVRAAIVDLLDDAKSLGSISRHAQDGATRLRALARLTDPEEVLGVALKSEHTDAAVAALERIDDPEALGAIAQRARNKVAARRARTKLRLLEEAARPAPPETGGRRCSAEDRAAGARICCIAPKGSSPSADPDAATARARRDAARLGGVPGRRRRDRSRRSTQQFEAASDAVREAIAERQQERAAEQERADAIAREQADRVAICQRDRGARRAPTRPIGSPS